MANSLEIEVFVVAFDDGMSDMAPTAGEALVSQEAI